MAYKLDLPPSSKLHPVFHVSSLKPFHGTSVSIEPSLLVLTNGELQPLPKALLDSRIIHNQRQVLVHWDGLSLADSSWEDVSSFQTRFPSFVLVNKCSFNGVSNVMFNVDKKLTNKEVINNREVISKVIDMDVEK
ncbi:hypothetical protein SADUNF_Sadunf05G0112500 [Salix dunnii]|uniref:Tf2-1-like SH3-like domain-containing protein n=1 Tax=Salix dunnii TaxID=1413687 RepID=A0A835K5Q5_9ROSI|nr:hypothetical protein SADUNF_Sadunf05G0112500 [Salix dunnii]